MLLAVLTAPTMDAAAEQAGVSRSTLYRAFDNPAFRERFHAERDKLLDAALDAFTLNVFAACKTLAELMETEDARVRRAAAKDVLGFALQIRKDQALEARVCALEEIARTRHGRA